VRVNPELIARHYMPDIVIATPSTPPETLEQTLADLRETFKVLDNMDDRYQYIIDIGQVAERLLPKYCTEAHRLHGCQSQVWLVMVPKDGRLYIHAASDAAIVSGLIVLIRRIYSGRTPAEILAMPHNIITEIGLGNHLSPTRKNGLFAMVETIINVAAHVQNLAEAA